MSWKFTVSATTCFVVLELWVYLSSLADPGQPASLKEWEWVLSLGLLGASCLAFIHILWQARRRWSLVSFMLLCAVVLLSAMLPLTSRPHSPYKVDVLKSSRRLVLHHDGVQIGAWQIALNGSKGDKQVVGDGKTPEGVFVIVDKAPSQFHKWLGLNYPNLEDAWRGRREGKITWLEFWRLRVENLNGRYPYANSSLGGAIGIHGGGNRADWTLGCIALNNSDVDFLYDRLPLGTVVEIFP